MRVVQLNYALDETLTDPEKLLDTYCTLTGWSDAIAAAGADRISVVQRFHKAAHTVRNGVEYTFCRSGLHRAVAEARPDVVHVNGLIFPARTWLLRRTLDPPTAIVVQDHGGGVPDPRPAPVRRAIQRRLFRAADAFLFAAAGRSDAWRRAGVLPPDRRVYQVMEASTTFRPMPRDRARVESGVDGTPALLWVGRLNANKDPLTVLNGFEQALADLPAAKLTIVYSSDELLAAVRARVHDSPALRDRVRLAGRVCHDVLPAFYSAADIFVLGSHHEGSGYALLEACACGAIPVVTDIPTFRVITAGGSVGALWTAGDSVAFARALQIVSRSDLALMRTRMAERFERTLSWSAIGREAMSAYRDALVTRRARLRAAST